MTTSVEQEAANIIAPLLNIAAAAGVPELCNQMALPITAASTVFDLNTYLTAWRKGHFLTLHADGGDVYLAFHKTSGGTVDPTVTTAKAVTLCQRIPSGQDRTFRLPANDSPNDPAYQFITARTSAGTATLRGYISSIGHMEDIRALQP
jgi:hypothetical protein